MESTRAQGVLIQPTVKSGQIGTIGKIGKPTGRGGKGRRSKGVAVPLGEIE